MALYHRIGSATLFGGTWRLLPVAEHRQAQVGAGYRYVLAVIDLPDGRSIAATGRSTGDTHWVVCRLTETRRRDAIDLRPHRAELADDPADVPCSTPEIRPSLWPGTMGTRCLRFLPYGTLPLTARPAKKGPQAAVPAPAFPRSMQARQTRFTLPARRTPPGQSTGSRQTYPGNWKSSRF